MDESAGSDDVESYAEAESDTVAEGDKAYDEETDETYGEEADEADDEETEEPEYDPEQAAFLCDRGRDHRANGDLEQALTTSAKRSISIRTRRTLTTAAANIYFLARQFDEAIADYNEAIRINPDLAIAYLNRGLAYARKQDSAEALADASSAIQLDPTLAGAYYLRGTSHYRLDDATEAIRDLTQAIRLNSADPAVYNQRGLAYAKLGDYDRAIEDYDHALRLAPDLVVAHFHRASAYQLKGDPIRAIAEFSEVVQLDPKNAEAYYQRGVAYAAQGEYELAIADFTESYRLDPNNALAVFKRDEAVRAKKQAAKPRPKQVSQPRLPQRPAQPNGQEVITCPGCGKRLTPSELRRRRVAAASAKHVCRPPSRSRPPPRRQRRPRKKTAFSSATLAYDWRRRRRMPGTRRRALGADGPSDAVGAIDRVRPVVGMRPRIRRGSQQVRRQTLASHRRRQRNFARRLRSNRLPGALRLPLHPSNATSIPAPARPGMQVDRWLTVVGKCKCYGAPDQPIQLLGCRIVNAADR